MISIYSAICCSTMTLLGYLLSLRIVVFHSVTWPLLYDLSPRLGPWCLALGLAQELLIWILWTLIDNSFSVIISTYICIKIYEKTRGPKITLRQNAIFVTENDLSGSAGKLQRLGAKITLRGDELFQINTDLQWTVTPRININGEKNAVNIEDVMNIKEGPECNIKSTIEHENIKAEQCFQVEMPQMVLTLAAQDETTRDEWLDVFQKLYAKHEYDVGQAWLEGLLGKEFSSSESFNTDETLQILVKANRQVDTAYAREILTSIQKKSGGKSESLTQEQLKTWFKKTAFTPDIEDIYGKLINGGRDLPPGKLMTFMKTSQKEDVSLEACRALIKRHEPVFECRLSVVGFTNLLLGAENCWVDPKCTSTVYHDMSRPLSDYYIATSHNTYLTKDQLKSKSKVKMYVSALQRGCKCLELDCWDGPYNEPIIYHGHTLTSKILFKDVIQAIRDHAFDVSPYPVILSFENHCSIEQQKVMAKHLVEILQDMLYTKQPPEDEDILPSPDALKNYVLVKNKKLKEGVDETEEEDDDFSDVDEEEVEQFIEEGKVDTELIKEVLKDLGDADSVCELDLDEKPESTEAVDESISKEERRGSVISILKRVKKLKKRQSTSSLPSTTSSSNGSSKKKKGLKVAQELSDLVAYCQAVHFQGFQHAEKNLRHFNMSSFGEKRAFKFVKDQPMEMLTYSRRRLSRTYPAGGRIDSSNYDPVPLWNVGCQMVALNYQTNGTLPMHVNQAQFMDNGSCGYVLKPPCIRDSSTKFDPRGPFKESTKLSVKIISAHQLPHKTDKETKREKDVLIQVRIIGVEEDNTKIKTKAVKTKGFVTLWQETLTFDIKVKDLAFINLTMMDGNTMLGQTTAPLRCIRPGLRWAQLYDKTLTAINHAKLLLEITMD